MSETKNKATAMYYLQVTKEEVKEGLGHLRELRADLRSAALLHPQHQERLIHKLHWLEQALRFALLDLRRARERLEREEGEHPQRSEP